MELSGQELVNRLVQAPDAVFVCWWLCEMRKRGMLTMEEDNSARGMVQNHSTKNISAVVVACREEETPIRRFILELLMHFVSLRDNGRALATAVVKRRSWAVELMATWEKSGGGSARDSKTVLAMTPHEAGHWLDANFRPPSNAHFTGCDTPPPPSSTTDVEELLQSSNILFSRLSILRRGASQCASFNVASRSDWLLAYGRLEGALWDQYTLYIERNSPPRSVSHPLVVIWHVPFSGGVDLVDKLSREARCGAYERCMTLKEPDGSENGIGT
ncbi:hypothetical protein JCM8547_007041, partial [Rhodosporidiobolus lusitaniae]